MAEISCVLLKDFFFCTCEQFCFVFELNCSVIRALEIVCNDRMGFIESFCCYTWVECNINLAWGHYYTNVEIIHFVDLSCIYIALHIKIRISRLVWSCPLLPIVTIATTVLVLHILDYINWAKKQFFLVIFQFSNIINTHLDIFSNIIWLWGCAR